MKYLKLFIILNLLATPAFAQGGGHVGGGGEDGVFKSIRDEINTWMLKNLALKALDQKLELKSIQGEALYAKFDQAWKAVGEKVIFNHEEIKLGNNVRICKNEPELMQITCNIELWNNTRGDTRYMIVFHEYLGIAGIESNTSISDSQYPISPKILGFVQTKTSFELGMDRNDEDEVNPDRCIETKNSLGYIKVPCVLEAEGGQAVDLQDMLIGNVRGFNKISKKAKFGFVIESYRAIVLEDHIRLGHGPGTGREHSLIKYQIVLSDSRGSEHTEFWNTVLWTVYEDSVGGGYRSETRYQNKLFWKEQIRSVKEFPIADDHDPVLKEPYFPF